VRDRTCDVLTAADSTGMNRQRKAEPARRSSRAAFKAADGHRVRQVGNLINLSTPLGLAVGFVGGATWHRGPGRTILATSVRLRLRARAMTIGDVILTRRSRDELLADDRLVRHELRHTVQYATCLGVVMVAAYPVAALWSWAITGSRASWNPFERLAGLDDGNYADKPPRWRTVPADSPARRGDER
jgi:hypothetical protein